MSAKSKLPKSKAKTAYGLLREVKELILAEPKRYCQYGWLSRWVGKPSQRPDSFPACGTIGCIAGWVATLKSDHDFTPLDSPIIAAEILGISRDQGDELFSAFSVSGSPQSMRHAKSGAAHIDGFLKRYAKQLKAKRV